MHYLDKVEEVETVYFNAVRWLRCQPVGDLLAYLHRSRAVRIKGLRGAQPVASQCHMIIL